MSESKHTPGPWGIHGGIEVWIMAGGVHVDTVPRSGDGDWSPANARLIAAAPEMLEQHEADLGDLELLLCAVDAGDPALELRFRINEILRRKSAIIAKAKGE